MTVGGDGDVRLVAVQSSEFSEVADKIYEALRRRGSPPVSLILSMPRPTSSRTMRR